ncbi:ribbon-helix-helix protein, CopG family [Rudaeicoccus suwonensis]|nr:ribbon-helix-helix protein, CopG family [Rudaeicoccus suwonensis]
MVSETVAAAPGAVFEQVVRARVARAGSPGRPRLDPAEGGSGQSPRRQVRLPRVLSDEVDRLAAAQGRDASSVMRDAIAEYVQAWMAKDGVSQ